MKKINQKEWRRLQAFHVRLYEHFSNPDKQSSTLWRGDYRAIQWACWWIRETIRQPPSTNAVDPEDGATHV